MHTLSLKEYVWGLTLLNKELYVLCHGRTDNQVQVHVTTDYALLRRLSVPGLHRHDEQDMVSCQRNNCLYISDSGSKCIHRVPAVNGSVSKWKIPHEPCGLSVTPGGEVLVVCRGEPDRIVELTLDGGGKLRMRQIQLQPDIFGPCQAVRLTTGHFVVCQHGQSGLCEVDPEGKVVQAYGGVGQSRLRCPCHVTVDRNSEFVFVADHDNHRVVLLTSSLQFLCDVIEVALPNRLYLDHLTRRLYVGHGCDVTVVQL